MTEATHPPLRICTTEANATQAISSEVQSSGEEPLKVATQAPGGFYYVSSLNIGFSERSRATFSR